MKKALLFIALVTCISGFAQPRFSIATNVSGLRNFSKQQRFWALGQTVQANVHFSPKQSVYLWVDYYTEGKYKNNFTATGKSFFSSPQSIGYSATGRLTYRQLSVGWKHFFKGSFDDDKAMHLYGLAGFGLLFGTVKNSHGGAIDTVLYAVPVREGVARLRRLTFDVGAGAEVPLGGNVFGYADVRTWLPASSSASPYLHSNRNVPLPLIAGVGLRFLFGVNY